MGTPFIVFHIDCGGASPGLYREDRPGPARRVPNTIAIFSWGDCGATVDAGVGLASDRAGVGRDVDAPPPYGELDFNINE
jgi:hypothetical protein